MRVGMRLAATGFAALLDAPSPRLCWICSDGSDIAFGSGDVDCMGKSFQKIVT